VEKQVDPLESKDAVPRSDPNKDWLNQDVGPEKANTQDRNLDGLCHLKSLSVSDLRRAAFAAAAIFGPPL
jgi:hypothetical protein